MLKKLQTRKNTNFNINH